MNKLQEACIISHEHWLKKIEKTIESLNIDVPEIKVPQKATSIKDFQSKDQKNKSIKRKVIKILIIAAIITSFIVSSVAFTPFKDFVVEYFEDYNLFTSDSNKVSYPKKIEISYVPEGFIMTKHDFLDISILEEYQDNEKSFVITKSYLGFEYQISNTYTEEVVFYNEGVKYTFLQLKETVNMVVWLTEEYSYSLTGHNMTKEEMIELAKGIS